MAFYNRVWAKDDPFWTQNQPGNLWNCKCDWEETDDPVTDGNPTTPVRHDGLEGNPALTGEVFTDNCAYIKNAGANRKERDKVEMMCERLAIKNDLKVLSDKYTGNKIKCKLDGDEKIMQNKSKTINHFFDGLFGKKGLFWLRNEIIKADLFALLEDTTLVGKKVCNTTHNTNKETVRLKKATDFFFYYKKILPNGETIYLHIGRYRETGNMYLYDATVYNPIKK